MMSFVLSFRTGKKSSSREAEVDVDVDWRCCFSCHKWPNSVAIDGDKCFSTSCSVSPGKEDKKFFLIAFLRVERRGLNKDWAKKFARSFLVDVF